MAVFIDTNVPMYAAGAPHPLKEPALRCLDAVASGRLEAWTDAEVFQEILHRYFSIGARIVGLQIFDRFLQIMSPNQVLPVTVEDVRRARELAEAYPQLSPRDCIHAAVAERAGLREIVTADRAFDAIPFLRRIPLENFR